jgi:putative transposase
MRYRFVDEEKAYYRVERLCALMQVSRSGYYAWAGRGMSRKQRQDMVLLAHIRSEFESSHHSYGRPRMVEELKAKGFAVSHTRIGRLMRENGIAAIRCRKKRYKRNTVMPSLGYAPNLLDQNFESGQPNQKWVADISYILTSQGWVYLAVVMDLYSRRIVGWHMSDRMKQDLALKALNMAIALRAPKAGLIHHSDRGSQYSATQYQMVLKQHGIIPSMSGKGNCYDNAVVEAFFKTLKAELVWRIKFKTREQAERIINDYIVNFYNAKRRHSTLGNISPMMYEKLAA